MRNKMVLSEAIEMLENTEERLRDPLLRMHCMGAREVLEKLEVVVFSDGATSIVDLSAFRYPNPKI